MRQDMIFSRSADDHCRLLIPAAVTEELNQFRQTGDRNREAGGLLLGLRRGPHIEVVTITTPMPGDMRSRTSFLRRDPYHFQMAQRLWQESNRTIGYIGEWHTHPEQQPAPSGTDTTEWRKVLRLEKRTTVFVIVGTTNWFVARGPAQSALQILYPKWEVLREEVRDLQMDRPAEFCGGSTTL